MDLILDKNKCTGCGKCVEVCPFGAMELKNGLPEASDECRLCGVCVKKCPEGALSLPETATSQRQSMTAKDVWVFAESQEGGFPEVVFELLGKARDLADKLKENLIAVAIGDESLKDKAKELIYYGADIVYLLTHPNLKDFNERLYGSLIIDLLKQHWPNIFLAGATPRGRSLMPQIAAALETGLTADCTNLEIDLKTKELLQTRPAYGGNIMATITCLTRPQMSTVRPHVFPKPSPDRQRQGKVISLEVETSNLPSDAQVLEFQKLDIEGPSLTDAQIVIGVGRGIKDPQNLRLIKQLARLLGAQIGGTRAVVDAGWLPARCQIGQTGVTINPKLYIACGISGAIQHVVGIQSAKCIVAINKDPEAPIFEVADYGIVGDMFEVIPALIEAIKQSRGEA